MATNEETANLKVPPLKIVLTSSNSNSAVISNNISTSDESVHSSSEQSSFKSSSETNDNSDELADPAKEEEATSRDVGDLVVVVKSETNKQANKKNANKEAESYQPQQPFGTSNTSPITNAHSSSSSTSSTSTSPSRTASERSKSTSPSSESESVASNATIISDQQQQQQQQLGSHHQQQPNQVKQSKNVDTKQDKNSKHHNNKQNNINNSNNPNNKKSQDSNADNSSETNTTTTTTTSTTHSGPPANKEQQTLNANQRITRSSQRAAQQIKSENPGESNADELTNDNQDKIHESARKAKRKKGEVQETVEQDDGQSGDQSNLSRIYDYGPCDYQPPDQNSFELYRDIRKRPYKKLMKLNYIKPKVPSGFKDYLLSGGPYLLEGNKLGNGLFGARLENMLKSEQEKSDSIRLSMNSAPIRKKMTNLHQKWSSMYQPSQQRHNSYVIPKLQEPPKNLQVGLPLYDLFKDQEKARQQMRMQHLKEREKSILTAEQEILRAYNRSAIADVQQKLHLSACTYLYYQERYHYIEENETKKKKVEENPAKDVLSNNGDSDAQKDDQLLCTEGNVKVEPTDVTEIEALPSASSSSPPDEDVILKQLQEIDDKWAKIRKDMQLRHKNEADSLYAIQSLDWEWKAKESGLCDFRLSLKIEPEFVPRVNIVPMDY